MSNEFNQEVVDFLRNKPTDEQLFDFADKLERPADLLDVLHEKIEEVIQQKKNRKLDLQKDLLAAGNNDDLATRCQVEFQEWCNGAHYFQKCCETARRKLKVYLAEKGIKTDAGHPWDDRNKLLHDILESSLRQEKLLKQLVEETRGL